MTTELSTSNKMNFYKLCFRRSQTGNIDNVSFKKSETSDIDEVCFQRSKTRDIDEVCFQRSKTRDIDELCIERSETRDIDEVCSERRKTQDYKLEDLILPPNPSSKHLIDYRVKLLLKNDLVLTQGQEVLAPTACIIEEGIPDFCLLIKKSDNTPLTLLSEGNISELFRGRIHIKLANYKSEIVTLYSGTEVGFLLVNNFSIN